ncbi:tyrosine-type recombinase/integrase [Burkholderia ubonensis]|uniref:tyrosine-type recombinase/integrase n=1 Tax=Burkholderia ubonensis TaxID=101571 RepID=UPI0009B30079|nr:integrase arm-type DNA-binding domain-containing protein [Burkholderia ubonensis]
MLNDTQCRNAKSKDKPYKLTDGKGLYLEVKPQNKGKIWRYRYELGGKESTYTIGDYPAISLADARQERQRARDLVKQGKNPAHERQADRVRRELANAVTFEVVAKEWLAMKDWQENTKARRLDTLERVVFPSIGKLPVSSITPAHILKILQHASEKNGPTVAAEAKRAMSGVFELAIATLRAEVDPVHPVRKALPPNKTQHKRPLGTAEIGQLMRDLASYDANYQTTAAFRLMWLTLCRPNEVVEAKWDEFDLDIGIWRIPAGRMKMRAEHIVPLPTQAIECLKAQRALHDAIGNEQFVFPNRDDRSRPMTTAALRQALKTLGWSGKYSPHATRTTGSTQLNERGYPSDWIERQLAHIDQNKVRGTYNHAAHLESRAKMMQTWADTLDALRDGATVIAGQFRRAVG